MKPDLRIRPYDPNRVTRAPRISDADWERHKSFIQVLHHRGFTRPEMLTQLAEFSGFYPTLPQLNTKMAAWKFKVYGSNGVRYEDVPELWGDKISLLRGMAPAVHIDVPINRNDILMIPERESDNVSDDNLLSVLDDFAVQFADDSETSDKHCGVDLATLDLHTWDRLQLNEFLDRYKTEKESNLAYTQWLEGYDEFRDAMDIKMGLKAPPKSVSHDTHSSWSFHRVTGFNKSSVATSASDTSRRKVKKIKLRSVDEACEGLTSLE